MLFKSSVFVAALAALAQVAVAVPHNVARQDVATSVSASVSASASVSDSVVPTATDSGAPPPPAISTFTMTRIFNTVIPASPFLTVATTTSLLTVTVSATDSAVSSSATPTSSA